MSGIETQASAGSLIGVWVTIWVVIFYDNLLLDKFMGKMVIYIKQSLIFAYIKPTRLYHMCLDIYIDSQSFHRHTTGELLHK